MNAKIKNDDFACLHHSYHEDTDLKIIADVLGDEHGWAGSPLVWLYWPRMIAAAKAAKCFGWFSTTPRMLAQSVGDMTDPQAWNIRHRMWELLAARGLIRVRQGAVERASEKVDILLVEWDKWQSMTPIERKRKQREMERVEAGHEPHWTVVHLENFVTDVTTLRVVPRDNVTRKPVDVTPNGSDVTRNTPDVTTRDETRQDETKEDARGASILLPSIVDEACAAAAITGVRHEWWQSTIQKLRVKYASAPDDVFVNALEWIVVEVDGSIVTPTRAWSMLSGAVANGVKKHNDLAKTGAAPTKPRRTAAELLAQHDAVWSDSND